MKKFFHGFSIEDISKERSNGGFGLTADISNQTLERFANESGYIRVDSQQVNSTLLKKE